MYWTLSATVSAIAAYGSAEVLWLNLLFIPLIFRSKKDILSLSLLLAISLLSYYYFQTYVTLHSPEMKEESMIKSLTWSSTVKIDGAKVKGFAKDTNGIKYYLIYTLISEDEKKRLQKMDLSNRKITVEGVLELPEPPAHKYAFDMASYLRMNGAAMLFQANRMTISEQAPHPLNRLAERRSAVKEHIEKVFPESLQVEAKALLIGDRSNMDAELSSQYRKLGITHLFAISGLHVGLLTALLRTAAKRLFLRIETIDMALVFMLPCYALLAGGAPSVWRAVSVTILLLLSSTGKIKIKMDGALALSALGFMLIKPYILFQPGFQLSYVAAFSLLYSAKYLKKQHSLLVISASVTAITQLALLPILLVHFYELSLSSFFVNLVYVPLYSMIILPVNILLLAITFLSETLAAPLFHIYVPFRSGIGRATAWLAEFQWQVWTAGRPSVLWLLVMVTSIACCFVVVERWNRKLIGFAIVLIPAICFQVKPYLDPHTYVTFLDVGQGDSIVIELPFRKAVYVIDTGGTVMIGPPTWKTPEKPFEVGRQIVVPYLKGKGINTIDILTISHAHLDHIEGADEVLQELRVKEAHFPAGSINEEVMVPVIQEMKRQNTKMKSQLVGNGWSAGSAEFTYMSPFDDNYTHNDSSLVLLMKNDYGYLLFTGDLETDGEEKVMKRYGEVQLIPLILKVGHHGSKTSTTEPFLNFLQPEIAIISAGRNNRYGHPNDEVMERLAANNIKTYVTAEQGTIILKMRAKELEMSTTREKKKDSN